MSIVSLSVAVSPSLSVIVADAVSVIAPSARIASWSANGDLVGRRIVRNRMVDLRILGQRHHAVGGDRDVEHVLAALDPARASPAVDPTTVVPTR